jgi:uncharacterized protein involved in exopolysaccharide biosynthesis
MNDQNNKDQNNKDNSYGSSNEESIFIEIFLVLFDYKRFILFCVVIGGLFSVIYALTAPQVYRSDVLMIAATPSSNASVSGSFGGLAKLAGIDLQSSTGDNVDTAVAILKSRVFLEKYLKDNNYLPILFDDEWDQALNKWKQGKPPSPWKIYQRFRQNISVSIDKMTGNITFSVIWKDPQLTSIWANGMVSELNLYMKVQAIEELEKNIIFLNKQLENATTINLQSAIYALIQQQTEKIMLASVKEEYVFRIIDPALAPELRFKPKRKQIVMIGLFISFILAISISFSSHFYQNTFSKIDL